MNTRIDIEGLYERFADPVVRDNSLKSEIVWNEVRETPDQAMIDGTNCVVSGHAKLAYAILQTPHGSDQEKTFMSGLFFVDPSCAGPHLPDDISRSFLCAFLADSLLRLSQYGVSVPS